MLSLTICSLLFACFSFAGDTTQNTNAPQQPIWVQDAVQTEKMVLVDYDNHYTTLDSVLAEHSGKVVYVDFWASFCSPCLRAMPLSHKMREHYADKDVAFVYIAIHDRPERWRQASHDVGIDNGQCHSFFVVNSKQARVGKRRVGGLPCFMLFDKQGKLVEDYAPWPMSKEIRKKIDKLLEK